MAKSEPFDTFALEYDRWFDNHSIEYELEFRAIRQLLPDRGEGVEIGAGTGRFAQPLGIALGIEPSKAMRQIAAARGVHVIDGVAEALPLEDACYDYALLVTTVCFLDSLAPAFREVSRILKADGCVVVGFIDKESTLGKRYEDKKAQSKFYRDATFHSVHAIETALKEAGFRAFDYVQTLLPGDVEQGAGTGIKPGYGQGAFVVLRAQKGSAV